MKIRRLIPGWNLIEYLVLRGVAGLVNALPIEQATRMARKIGDFIFHLIPHRREIALGNLDIAYGDSLSREKKHQIAREAFRNLVTSLMEFFRAPSMLREAKERFEFVGTEHMDQAFARGKGVVFVTSHLGNWEYLSLLPSLRGYPMSAVVRETRNPYIYRWIQGLRAEMKLNPLNKKNSARAVLSELGQNHMVAILIDQWAGREGIRVEFFGKQTSTTSIPYRLARKTGAAIVPGYCLRTSPGRYQISIFPEVPIPAAQTHEQENATTLQLNRWLEGEILRHPEQWIWTHQRWKPLDNSQPNNEYSGPKFRGS